MSDMTDAPSAAAAPPVSAQPTVKTVQFTDPRIEPQPDPVYDYVIAPTQNQYYKIAASSKSNSTITFNNLTTLGVDRAYLDTFELELTCTFTFNIHNDSDHFYVCPAPDEWTFDSFPFNKCCDTAHVNINGGAFFSQPLSYIRAKEHYMSQEALGKCYENICPVFRPLSQYESGENYQLNVTPAQRQHAFMNGWSILYADESEPPVYSLGDVQSYSRPTRYGVGVQGVNRSQVGFDGGFNNSVVELGKALTTAAHGYANYRFIPLQEAGAVSNKRMAITVTWREPIFCSPFSSRYDADYGRPLYNITSMDMTFNLQNLGNMIRLMNFHDPTIYVESYTVNIDSAMLCYQVMTIPPILKKPLTTLVPYRRFVPYITDIGKTAAGQEVNAVPLTGGEFTVTSGVYTFNEIPNAIWVFCAPSKAVLQDNKEDKTETVAAADKTMNSHGNWDSNKQFAFLKHVDISMANTTQILNTAKLPDLYRIAKANGCQDSFVSWGGGNRLLPLPVPQNTSAVNNANAGTVSYGEQPAMSSLSTMNTGCGSVLRLKPGVDMIVPDQALIPGANANNMVFQCTATFDIPPHSSAQREYSLWLLFEYIGVAAISPGQCEITMNPLGSGEIMAASPIVSGSSTYNDATIQGGSGFWDGLRSRFEHLQQIAHDTGIISRLLRVLGGNNDIVQTIADVVEKKGYGYRGVKRTRGGAVMGKGLKDWAV